MKKHLCILFVVEINWGGFANPQRLNHVETITFTDNTQDAKPKGHQAHIQVGADISTGESAWIF
ncbi:MAG: hypothetical protein AABZ56_08740 [Bacteroidota bacterium]